MSNNYLHANYPSLASIPDFNMAEYEKGCAFTRHVARELLSILIDTGLNINYNRKTDGLTPLMYALKYRNFALIEILLGLPEIDVNRRGQYVPAEPNSRYWHELPPLHMVV